MIITSANDHNQCTHSYRSCTVKPQRAPNDPTDAEEKIKRVKNILTMQLLTGISRDTQSKSYMLSLTNVPGNPE